MRFLLLLLCGCGRLDFEPMTRSDAGTETTPCTSGQRLAPVSALNASPIDPLDACSLDSVLARDGLTAGLDRNEASCSLAWDDQGSCGCLAVDLGAVYMISAVDFWAAPVAQACQTACVGADCGSGHTFSIFLAEDLASPTKVGEATNETTALVQTHLLVVQATRYVLACRQGYRIERDDFAIDYVEAVCN